MTDTRNTVHGSDSPDSAKQEIGQVFADFDLEKWKQNEGRLFEKGFVAFDNKIGIHEPLYEPDFNHMEKITHNGKILWQIIMLCQKWEDYKLKKI